MFQMRLKFIIQEQILVNLSLVLVIRESLPMYSWSCYHFYLEYVLIISDI